MKVPRRQFLHLAAGAAALPAISRSARAQSYPSRPITMVVPFAPGGPADVVGRVVAERMRGSLGQPIIIENISGADGSIAPAGPLTRDPTATRLPRHQGHACAERCFLFASIRCVA